MDQVSKGRQGNTGYVNEFKTAIYSVRYLILYINNIIIGYKIKTNLKQIKNIKLPISVGTQAFHIALPGWVTLRVNPIRISNKQT